MYDNLEPMKRIVHEERFDDVSVIHMKPNTWIQLYFGKECLEAIYRDNGAIELRGTLGFLHIILPFEDDK